jgi:2'-5' RNA ligase
MRPGVRAALALAGLQSGRSFSSNINDSADNSPSPWGEGRGEEGRAQLKHCRSNSKSLISFCFMDSKPPTLQDRYDQLWSSHADLVSVGKINIDPILANKGSDHRRGYTVIARPSATTCESVTSFIHQLRVLEPNQYYYDPAELHVTILSLFTATNDFERNAAQFDLYREAVDAALAHVPEFSLEFRGIALTQDALMIQGFPDSAVLNDTREALRKELHLRHLGAGVDGRYRLETAHMTVVRFQNPLISGHALVQFLENFRNHSFGRTQVGEVQLVQNDWYMSRSIVEILKRYQLPIFF